MVLAGLFLYLNPQIPEASSYQNVQIETPLRVYSQNRKLLGEFGERRSIPINLEDVPKNFINALINTEDKRFYQHGGIDFISLSNDLFNLIGTFITDGKLGPGASTITMQLARNISFSLERRFLRKFKEMLLALKIERELSKDQILELYINLVPFGKRAYGAEAAANTYYGKSLSELDLSQLAMLAGIPQRPSAGNPINGPDRAIKRRNLVLLLMFEQGSISKGQYQSALAKPITAKVHKRELDLDSPYPAELARQQALNLVSDLYTGGYKLITTIDEKIQRASIGAIKKGLHSYDQKHGYRPAGNLLEENKTKNQAFKKVRSELSDFASKITRHASKAIETNQDGIKTFISEESKATLKTLLESISTYKGIEPSITVFVNKDYAIVVRSNGELEKLNTSDSLWARRYVDVDTRGPKIQSMKSILEVGDLTYIKAEDSHWKLSQIPLIEGASISMDPNTGQIKALVGGFDFHRNQYNHAMQAKRQPGSGFKPFIYSAAIDNGIMPADIFVDAPLVFEDSNLETQYRPDNDNKKYNGPTRLRQALYRSINLVSMRVLLKIGAGQALNYVPRFGFDTSAFPRNTQLAIGGGTMGVTPAQMVRAYSVIANGGFLINPHIIDKILDAKDTPIYQSSHPFVCRNCEAQSSFNNSYIASANGLRKPTRPQALTPTNSPRTTNEMAIEPTPAPRVLDPRNAYIMDSMLKDVVKLGTGRRALTLKRNDLAGKTGTTNDAADTWFNGYGSGLATSVWVGFTNHSPLGTNAYGSNIPLPIWIDIMSIALKGVEEKTKILPPGIASIRIDSETGQPTSQGNSLAIFEYFYREHLPRDYSTAVPIQKENTAKLKAVDLF